MPKFISRAAAKDECASRWPEGLSIAFGTYDGDGDGVYTDDLGWRWNVSWTAGGRITLFLRQWSSRAEAAALKFQKKEE